MDTRGGIIHDRVSWHLLEILSAKKPETRRGQRARVEVVFRPAPKSLFGARLF